MDSGTKCAWVIHESKAVQIHVHNNRSFLYVPLVPGSVKNLHNKNNSVILSLDFEEVTSPVNQQNYHVLYF